MHSGFVAIREEMPLLVDLQKRLAEADGEIAFARTSGFYPYFITNDILKDSVDEVLGIVERETR